MQQFEQQFRLPAGLLAQLVRAESSFNPNARSPAGAAGLGQLMPGTAQALGVKNVFDPQQNLMGTAKYLRQQLDSFNGNVRHALAAYNAGPGAVRKYNGIPPYKETQDYVDKIMSWWGGPRPAASPATAQSMGLVANFGDAPQRKYVSKEDQININEAWRTAPGEGAKVLADKQAKFDNQYEQQLARYQPQQVAIPTAGTNLGNNPFDYLSGRTGIGWTSTDNERPGSHVEGSYHYASTPWGVAGHDAGNASNPDEVLRKTAWEIRNDPRLLASTGEYFYDPLGWYIKNGQIIKGSIGGHGDHAHWGVRQWGDWRR